MISHNAANERIKRQYFTYLAEALGHGEQTVDAVAKAIARFEAYTRWRDFKKFHIEQANGFKQHLSDQRGSRSGGSAKMKLEEISSGQSLSGIEGGA